MTSTQANLIWKLARRHTWGSPLPGEKLIRLAKRDEDEDEMREILENEVATLPFVVESKEGFYIPNGQDAHVQAADWLRVNTELQDFDIKATLSRLPEDWPTDE